MLFKKLLPTLVFLCLNIYCFAQLVNDAAELNTAINAATPGTTIILANGIWNNTFIDLNKTGTSNNPITVTAQSPGAVFMTGNSRVYMEGAYITVSGLIFENPSNLSTSGSTIEPVFELKVCDYCKVLNNKIDTYNGTESQKTSTFKWILADGQYNEIAYNSFLGKYGIGSIINDNRNSPEPDYLSIHHNYFGNRTPINGVNDDNDQDAIRIGNSATSLDDSFSEVYDNYFHNFFGEIEMISNKSGHNKYYNNTFRNYAGTLTLRHGDDCEVYGNYFFAENNTFSGGIRVIGEGHKIYNNYIEKVNSEKADGAISNAVGGINVTNGRQNTAINGYYQVINAQVVNNTFVDCDYALRIGTQVKSDLDQEPVNLTIANNIMYNTSIDPYQIVTTPSGNSVSVGNLTNLATSDLADDGNFHRLTAGSTPIDAGIGNYSYLTDDILAGSRGANFDAGAEEYGANGTKLPYTFADVGMNIGFGALIAPTLSVSPSTLNFDVCGGTITFDVNANVDWTITENLSWLTLDITSGSGATTITATATQNNSGAQRIGSISVTENAGGNNLFTSVSIVQSNTSVANEIPIIGTTSLGMQQNNANVTEANAYNDDLTNYWTGNPDTEPEVSITFDLGTSQILTEIGIHFWKADERTTTFSIAVADVAGGPFTTIINNQTSAATGATVNDEQLFSLNNTVGQYVKFVGIGNSSTSNWTSIANINIYGSTNCLNNPTIPTLSTAPTVLNFPRCGGMITFDVNTTVDWTITENLSWLNLDITSGSGTATVTATVTPNGTSTALTGTITINEIAGGNSLSTTVTATQTNTITAAEIPVVSATSLGMQPNNPIVSEVNAYNDDLTNYWTGNPDTEPEVSITFDLGTSQILTEIGIHFWKADERTTTFSIAVADVAAGPFTTIISNQTSAATGATVNDEQLFSLNNVEGRYVKFIGIGNSSANNWTSIANVNIYGDENCAPTNNCPNILVENNNPIPYSLYQAIEIHSAGTVLNPDVDFEAANFIQLNPGFEVIQGAIFNAIIIGCN